MKSLNIYIIMKEIFNSISFCAILFLTIYTNNNHYLWLLAIPVLSHMCLYYTVDTSTSSNEADVPNNNNEIAEIKVKENKTFNTSEDDIQWINFAQALNDTLNDHIMNERGKENVNDTTFCGHDRSE